ncbi:RPA-related protein RADX-like [Hydractinia symbiolongicarpus]|uniref:RPA-related protein RADX-like n=1 Tax=Hydractinia symbiolongicarpus TaxID=13093 RepID=UPI00255037FD|nr:RPA-related protein RADX-like [Hydractinia symbiolongicarpus]
MMSNEKIQLDFVLVKKIERYRTDNDFILKTDITTKDAFDVTLSNESRKVKCLLHPKLNSLVYRGILNIGNVVQVKKYEELVDDTNVSVHVNIIVLTDIQILRSVFAQQSMLHEDESLDKPLGTSKEYYLPLYNNEDLYGSAWDRLQKEIKVTEIGFSDLTTIKALQNKQSNSKEMLPVFGTVIAKSKLNHYDSKGKCKYPFNFSIEVEHDNTTCSVTFWNKACLSYFKPIQVGQNIVLKKYRLKRRYASRSNTIFGISKDSGLELSINPSNPEGEVEFSNDKITDIIVYRFLPSSVFGRNLVPVDSIADVTGCISFIGRIERERKSLNTPVLSSGDFWMYRWLVLKDGVSDFDIKIKIYACSQSETVDKLKCGDMLVATRVLCKGHITSYTGKQRMQMYAVSIRETQLYSISSDWELDDVKTLPFVKYIGFLNVLRWSKNANCRHYLSQNSYEGGYFSHPALPDELNNYVNSFPLHSPFKVISSENLVEICDNMHVYETMRVSIQATIAVIEFIPVITDAPKSPLKRKSPRLNSSVGKRKRSGGLVDEPQSEFSDSGSQNSSQEEAGRYPFRVIDRNGLEVSDKIKNVGDVELTEESKRSLTGGRKDLHCMLRILLFGLNKKVAVMSSLIPKQDPSSAEGIILDVLEGRSIHKFVHRPESFLENAETMVKPDDRFLFVLDLYYKGKNDVEVVINRGFRV